MPSIGGQRLFDGRMIFWSWNGSEARTVPVRPCWLKVTTRFTSGSLCASSRRQTRFQMCGSSSSHGALTRNFLRHGYLQVAERAGQKSKLSGSTATPIGSVSAVRSMGMRSAPWQRTAPGLLGSATFEQPEGGAIGHEDGASAPGGLAPPERKFMQEPCRSGTTSSRLRCARVCRCAITSRKRFLISPFFFSRTSAPAGQARRGPPSALPETHNRVVQVPPQRRFESRMIRQLLLDAAFGLCYRFRHACDRPM